MNRAFSAAVEIERIPRALPPGWNEYRAFGAQHILRERKRRFVRWAQAIPERSIAEGNFDVAGSLNHLAIGRDQPQTIDRIGDGDVADLIVLIADHRSEVSFID